MFFTLLKEIPQMFVIAAIIWGFVLILFLRNSRRKEKTFIVRHRLTLLAALAALVLTVVDVWVFVEYIPTHFKKHPVEEITLSAIDLPADSSLKDSIHKPVMISSKKDSVEHDNRVVTDSGKKTFLTNKASIHFFSHGDAEDIEATNYAVVCSFNAETGQLKFTGMIKGFQFENEMMQDHFNSKKYMDSETFPKTTFTGTIQDLPFFAITKTGNYPVTAEGALTIHGITKNMKAKGQIIVAGNKVTLKSVFTIKRIDFGITTDEIADELDITVAAGFN